MFVKHFLSIVFLLVIGCLTVSTVSPGLHTSLFHDGQECPHGKSGKPCSSHKQESSEENPGVCAVILFGESSEHTFIFSFFATSVLCDLGVSIVDSEDIVPVFRFGSYFCTGDRPLELKDFFSPNGCISSSSKKLHNFSSKKGVTLFRTIRSFS